MDVSSSGSAGRPRPRRPASLDQATADALPGGLDPAQRAELAHTTAAALVRDGRAGGDDPAVLARLVGLVEREGLELVATLWSDSPPSSLPGALWRLYVLREWVRRDPVTVADRYRQGVEHAPVQGAVAGVALPPGPEDVRATADAVLSGVYAGDLAVALERAAAFCRVLATGGALDADHLDLVDPSGAGRLTRGSAALGRTAEELTAAAGLWRAGALD
ncbi:hypothetical protein [Cellulomonas marina]|uniref:DNA-directed RNA polymerase subunit beta n=1 Tax=Cellulomonas marina TaxID=988821 RepID=A0A1I0XET6_9CELL|nr:hypothetical protein [Cellulomonas marina]GIG29871.1 hypothetical protein Cma02nite_24710 [Cellulomonas marina]SFA99511.1 hypothetical protein SAMN05421867_1059 [Cellulomonas marina]